MVGGNPADDFDEQMRENPDRAMELIEEFLKSRGERDQQTVVKKLTKDGGEIFYVTLTSIRTDIHVVQAPNEEDAVDQAQEASSNEDGTFSRRYEHLEPIVFATPRDATGSTIAQVDNNRKRSGSSHSPSKEKYKRISERLQSEAEAFD